MKTLAVFTPVVGTPTESFVTRHILELYPGKTVVVALGRDAACSEELKRVPSLILDTVPEVERRGLLRKRTTRRDRVIQFLAEHKVSVVLCEYLDFAIQYRKLVQNQGIPFFAYALGYDVSHRAYLDAWADRYPELNECQGVFAVAHFLKRRMIEMGVKDSKVDVIPSGADLPPERRAVRSEKQRIIAVGRLVPKKAPLIVLESFLKLADAMPNVELHIIGDGPLRNELEARISESDAGNRVVMRGTITHQELKDAYGETDLFVQHSIVDPDTGNTEGLPVAVTEALAYSLPVVASNHAGIPELIIDGETGWLVEEGDVQAMAEAMQHALQDRDEAERRARNGRRHVEDGFTWESARARLMPRLFPGEAV